MKNLIIALSLFMGLVLFGSFVLIRSTEAQTDVLPLLIRLPAPPPPNPLVANRIRNRPEDFFDSRKPPADNAPIEDLLDYWKMQNENYRALGYNPEPSDKVLERLLSEIEKEPDSLSEFIKILPPKPEVAAFAKQMYDRIVSDESAEKYSPSQIKTWLKYNSSYYADELVRSARSVTDTSEGYVTNQEELLALGRVDWERAKPILDRLYNDRSNPVSQTLARWALYRRALDTDSLGDIEKYRDELKADVENKSASDGLRDLALDALVKEKDWSGRDGWYFSLLEDETLGDLRVGGQSYTGLTTILLYAPAEKYADKMIELVRSNNPAVRNAAVRNLGTLLDEKNPEVIKALLPWLEDEKWAKETDNERRKLVAALQTAAMPESVPGLIAVLDEKASRQQIEYSEDSGINANVMANVGNTSRRTTTTVEFYPYRDQAIGALATQKDIRAAPALRRILPEVESYQRANVVRAILLSNGFSTSEQVEALEIAAKGVKEEMESEQAIKNRAMTMNSNIDRSTVVLMEAPPALAPMISSNSAYVMSNSAYSNSQETYDPALIKFILGNQVIANSEPGAELVRAVVERIAVLDKNDPPLARALRRIMLGWEGTAVYALLLGDLKTGRADINSIIKLLSLRKHLREKQVNDIFDIRTGGNPLAFAVSACLLESPGDYEAILNAENTTAKTALLGCARLIRARLPLEKVAQNLNAPDKLLALAAERYLESEDSPEARQIVLSRHPNEAKILGATTYFGELNPSFADYENVAELFATVNETLMPSSYYLFDSDGDEDETEIKLQKEVIEDKELLGVYAFDKNFVRIYETQAVFSWSEDDARYYERALTQAEFDGLKNYLAANRVDELPPFLAYCDGCEEKQLLMLGRQGGRRVYFKGDKLPDFFAGLERIFGEMRQPPARLRYWLEKDIAGLEILFADDNLKVQTLWKNGGDFRLLVNDTRKQKQIQKELNIDNEYEDETDDEGEIPERYVKDYIAKEEQGESRAFESYAWYQFANGKLSGIAGQPPLIEFPPVRDSFEVKSLPNRWKTRAANVEIRSDSEGLYKISGGQITKIREGYFSNPAITPDGRWLIVSKYGEEESLVRINLATNKEFIIKTGDYPMFGAVAFIPSVNKILYRVSTYGDYRNDGGSNSGGKFYLLDAETGAVMEVKGEVRPLVQQSLRPLQPTANADEFWAAIPSAAATETQVGIFNSKMFSFKPVVKVPRISFNSMNLWVDETDGKIYFVYEGQLLALPLPKR